MLNIEYGRWIEEKVSHKKWKERKIKSKINKFKNENNTNFGFLNYR